MQNGVETIPGWKRIQRLVSTKFDLRNLIEQKIVYVPPAPTPRTDPHMPVCPPTFRDPLSQGSKSLQKKTRRN